MSFRKYGGTQYSAIHNIVNSNVNTTSKFYVTQNIGQPNTYINFESDISGNIIIYGNLDVSGNSHISDNLDVSGNINLNGILYQNGVPVDFSGNSIWITSGTSIYYNSGNVGIGTSTPVSLLDVSGNMNISGNLDVNGLINTPDGIVFGNNTIGIGPSNSDLNLNCGTGSIYLYPSGVANGMVIINNGINEGSVGINNNNPQYTLDVGGNVNATSYNSSSDYRIKNNIVTLDETFTVNNLRPVTYNNIQLGKQDIGLIAHELQEVYPFLVNGEKDGENLQSVNYTGLIGILIKEIQELKKEVEILKDKIISL